ncbi:RHS repeat domain-containing protein, partial [Aeromonas veronii]
LSQTLGGQFEGARTQGNRLLLSGDRHFEYDEFGRLAIERRGKGQSLVTRYHYDCQHQLIRAELPDGTTARYDYDAFGRRIRKTVSGTKGELVTEFLWQANNLIAENSYQLGDDKRRTDEQYRSFIYEPGSFKPLVQLEGEGQDAEVFHYQLDHLGTPLALTRDNGATAWQVRYRAYGNVWREEIAEVATPLRFQGQYFDAETGLHYNRHRYYQPETGRFITPDPIGLAGGLNNYQYAPNPISWIDPLGLKNVKENGLNNNRFGKYSTNIDDKVDLLEKDTSLPDWIKDSFLDGEYRTVKAKENITLYRVFGGHAEAGGGFVSTKPALSRIDAKIEAALRPDWKNTRMYEAEIIVPKGTILQVGKVAPQPISGSGTILDGGADQVLMPINWSLNLISKIRVVEKI